LGCIQYDSGLLVSALDSFEESLEIQRSLLGNKDMLDGIDECSENWALEPEIDFTLLQMSTTLSNIGIIFWKRSCFGHSLSFLEESLILQQSVLEDLVQPLFIQRAETLITHLCNDHLQFDSNEIFPCGEHSFRCIGSNFSGSTFKRAISFVTTRESSSAHNNIGDHLSTKVVHYIFHSIHMISLSAPQSAFSSSRKSNSTTPSGASASQQRLRSLIDQSLHYYSGLLCNEEREESDSNSTRCDSTIVSERTHAPKQKLIISLAEAEAQSTECQPLDMNFHLIHKYSIQCLIAENYTEAILLYQNILSTATVLSRKKNAKADYDAVSGMALHHLGIIFMYAEANEDARTVLQKAVELRLEVCQRLDTNNTSRLPSEDLVASYYAVAVSFASLALNLFLLSQYENAIIYFTKSLRFLKKIPCSPWIEAHISQVLNNIACVHLFISEAEIKNSLVALNTAISQCAPQSCRDHESQQIYTTLLVNKGMAELYSLDYGLSLISFDEALRHLKQLKKLPEAEEILQCMAFAMACSKCNGEESDKKIRQKVQNYKAMLANSCIL
jgi:tetratricopeptide (TPR) repeat protein